MRHIAIVGSGPAGYYTAEACQKQFGHDVCIDILDKMPVPFGLIRSGVAPDHQSIKAVARRYKVSGSWEKPQITQLARARPGRARSVDEAVDEPAPAPVPAAAPAADAPEPAPWLVPLPGGEDGLQ